MSVLKLPLLVDLQEKIGELVISISSCPTTVILETVLNLCTQKNVVVVTLTAGIMFLLFTCMHFRVWGILRRWSACAPTACEVVRDCETLH
jgi:hypothetical protein